MSAFILQVHMELFGIAVFSDLPIALRCGAQGGAAFPGAVHAQQIGCLGLVAT